MGSWFVAASVILGVFLGFPQAQAEGTSPQGTWNRSSWWCASKISPAFRDKSCSLTIGFNREGQCSQAELIYWWSAGRGILEHFICESGENGEFRLYRERAPNESVYEGRIIRVEKNLWEEPQLVVETAETHQIQKFEKGRP